MNTLLSSQPKVQNQLHGLFVDMTPVPVTNIEELDLSSALLCRVSTDLTDGFAFPYYLFIPQVIDSNKPIHLLVEAVQYRIWRQF